MIFVTVGTQLPFDRMVEAVDAWAGAHPGEQVFAQIGPGGRKTAHVACAEFLSPDRAEELFRRSSLVIAHAGMGSLLTALRHRIPIIVMPRRRRLGEHRNEHQSATARRMEGREGVTVVWNAEDLPAVLDRRSTLKAGPALADFAPADFSGRINRWILDGGRP